MTIPAGVLYALIPVLAAGGISFLAWLVVQIGKIGESQAATTANLTAVNTRLNRLEAWQDGVQFGRAVAKAERSSEST